MGGRRPFGSIRRLASGRWQAAYWWEGARHLAPRTFNLKSAAAHWLSTAEADLARGGWVDPRASQITFERYSRSWLAMRTDLRPRTREPYVSLLKLHLVPALGRHEIGRITPSVVRSWFADLHSGEGPGQATAARAYRLLRTILNTAVTDELIVKNPCQVKGAGSERWPERVIATVPQVHALADAIAPRFRAAVLLAAYCSLRKGEILALRRGDVDLLHGTVSVRRAVVSLASGELYMGDPKTAAGRRTVASQR
jgi:integrase